MPQTFNYTGKRALDYGIEAKPTSYEGTVFRSRLEARYARFFDLMGWEWEYEPCMLGNWKPDFVLPGATPQEVFIEIKPLHNPDPRALERIETNAGDNLVALLGLEVTWARNFSERRLFRMGWLMRSPGDWIEWEIPDTIVGKQGSSALGQWNAATEYFRRYKGW